MLGSAREKPHGRAVGIREFLPWLLLLDAPLVSSARFWGVSGSVLCQRASAAPGIWGFSLMSELLYCQTQKTRSLEVVPLAQPWLNSPPSCRVSPVVSSDAISIPQSLIAAEITAASLSPSLLLGSRG